MTFNATLIDEIDQSTVENAGPEFPIIQWRNGNRQLRKVGGQDYTGGWFVPSDMVSVDLTERSWDRLVWEHDDGSTTEGFAADRLTLAVLGIRKRWEVFTDGQRTAFAWNDFKTASTFGRPSSRLHVLALVKGLEDLGPLVLTLRGTGAMCFEGNRKVAGALTWFARTVIRAANIASDAAARKAGKTGGQRWPFRAFWLTVGSEKDAKGEPVFTTVGSGSKTSQVTNPVAVGLPGKPEEVNLDKFFVGAELLRTGNELVVEHAGWFKEWDRIDPNDEQPNATANGNMNGAGLADDVQFRDDVPDTSDVPFDAEVYV